MSGALIVQSDRTVLLEVDHPEAATIRHELAIFADLERAPEHVHTYRLTKLGLWNARAAGHDADFVLNVLNSWAKFPVPTGVDKDIRDTMSRFGTLELHRDEAGLLLTSVNEAVLVEVTRHPKVSQLLEGQEPAGFRVRPWARGQLKQELLKIGWPAEDYAGFTPGEPLTVELNESGWSLRDYQRQAVEKFCSGGSGVVVLPCGSGKTLVGAAAMGELDTSTLILVTNTVAGRQWRDELLARTNLTEGQIGEYSGAKKDVAPVTIATYQILTSKRKGEFAHLSLLSARDWGLVIYDEVHLLPAPVFKLTAELQARRRLGLTATLVREDSREGDVFSLIGPKRFDAPWKEIEAQGYIAPAMCTEVRITLPDEERLRYATANPDDRFRMAATTPLKIPVVRQILQRHPAEPTLIIGQYLDQIAEVADTLNLPSLTGDTPISERERLYREFREGKLQALVVSKVANFSIDLPEASVAIQISGSFGSRQEEAQRLGRLLRPKQDGRTANFYSVISRDTVEQDFAQNRQRFLSEQGYSYEIVAAEEL